MSSVMASAEEGNGILASYGYFEGVDTPENKAFLERLTEKLGAGRPVMNELAIRSYEGAMLWAEAVKQAETTDREPVIEALRSGLAYDGPSGKVTIDAQTNHCSMNVYIAELQDQTWNIVDSAENQPPSDTQLVCDLNENPNQSAFLFENGLEAAGIE